MGPGWQPWTWLERRSSHVSVKLFALVLLVYLTFRILFSGFVVLLPVPESPAVAVDRSYSTEVTVGAEDAVEIYHDEQYKSRTWHFPSHNFTISLIWSPFLIKAEIFENDDGESKSENQLHLDTVDENWTSQYNSFDYMVISGGQWFLKTAVYMENNTDVGCHYCPKLNLSELGYEYAYSKTLKSVFHFVATSEHKPIIIYRTWAPDHFEYGQWFSGGVCNRSAPYKAGEFDGREVDRVMRKIELEEFNRAVALDRTEQAAHLKLLDTFQLSLLRPDAHSGPYRRFHPFEKDKNAKVQNDCLHWCLPGAIDAWNDLIMKLILDE
ncbi:hypothetical protein B296_00057090 [Ensete ventricosum]|uniref:Trichome birefringence-like C-terminal domain-containing protein n=1 Tax=Ensete ventricosum TaxID=4639 RepID=A0A426X5A3_ENSVE|nr:hypothetical protein B296_00057090 [Ensete ventricosum]